MLLQYIKKSERNKKGKNEKEKSKDELRDNGAYEIV